MLIAVDGRPAGLLAAADPVKDDSPAAVAAMRCLGLDVVVITGDSRRTAEAVAAWVGITQVLVDHRDPPSGACPCWPAVSARPCRSDSCAVSRPWGGSSRFSWSGGKVRV